MFFFNIFGFLIVKVTFPKMQISVYLVKTRWGYLSKIGILYIAKFCSWETVFFLKQLLIMKQLKVKVFLEFYFWDFLFSTFAYYDK